MVATEIVHDVVISGVDLQGKTYGGAALLQMNQEDFPRRFLDDLAKMADPGTQLSSLKRLSGSITAPATVYQPVQRILHVAVVQLACDALMQPRLDPLRVESAGIVIRRLQRVRGGSDADQDAPVQAWTKTPDGRFQWTKLKVKKDDDEYGYDPDPVRRPALKSGQPLLDAKLAASAQADAVTEVYTPAFLAPPAVNGALGRTIAYAVVPSASSDVSDATQGVPVYTPDSLINMLPPLLKYNTSAPLVPAPNGLADYRWLSDDFASKQLNSDNFSTFTLAFMMLFRQFNAFDGSAEAQAILNIFSRRNVTFKDGSRQPKGQFLMDAYEALIDFDPASSSTPKTQLMPISWDPVTQQDQNDLLPIFKSVLGKLSSTVKPPEGRYQDASRLYVAKVFFRIKGHTPACPTVTHWSHCSDIFKIAPWYDSTQRTPAPIPLPDPTLRSFLKGAKPNVSFAVPDGLMAAMQGTTLKGLSDGSGGGKKLGLNWICGFNIPLITICAFFVLNIFLILLNIVFFWLPFIKICIPFPVSEPASGDD